MHTPKTIQTILVMLLAAVLLVWGAPTVWAQDTEPGETTETGETSSAAGEGTGEEAPVGNATTNARVDNLARASVDPSTIEGMTEAQESLQTAETNLANVKNDPNATPEQIEAAEEALEAAQEAIDGMVAEAVGARADEIAQMREDGLGWGQIAHELGLHPGSLGMGHYKAGKLAKNGATLGAEGALAGPTARNFKGGIAPGHGLSADGSRAMGNGLGKEKDKTGKGLSGKSASAGKSGSAGKSSNAGGNSGKGGGNSGKGGGKNKD
jgi:hypothetical protein